MDTTTPEKKEIVNTVKNMMCTTFNEALETANQLIERIEEKSKTEELSNQSITINVMSENLYKNYIGLLEKGLCYASNICGSEVTKIIVTNTKKLTIKIVANIYYKDIMKTCEELDVPYKEQMLPTLAKELFCGDWTKSYFSKEIHAVMDTDLTMIGGLNFSKESTGDHQGIDCYRNYASIAMEGDLYHIDLMSELEPYVKAKGEFKKAMYYLETDNTFPLNGNGIYDYKIVQYCVAKGLIEESCIKQVIPVTMSPNNDKVLRDYITNIYDKVSDSHCKKSLVNFLIGSFGTRKPKTSHEAIITTNVEEAHYYNTTSCAEEKKITTICHTQDKPVYMVSGKDSRSMMASNRPVFMAIVQRARLKMAILWDYISEKVECVAVHTDCIIYKSEENLKPSELVNIPDEPNFGDFRVENITKTYFPDQSRQPCCYRIKETRKEWNIMKASRSDYFNYEVLLPHSRVYINGFAGSGKSHVVKQLAAHFEKDKKNRVITCSFTNKASLIVKGSTIHASFGIGFSGNVFEGSINKLLKSLTHVIIDEMSTVTLAIYKILSQLPSHIKIYGFGDFKQFEPVEPEVTTINKFYDETMMFKSLFGFNRIELRKQCRQDAKYANECVDFYKTGVLPEGIKVSSIKNVKIPNINICYTNKRRKEINNIKINTVAKKKDIDPIKMKDRHRIAFKPEGTSVTCLEHFDLDALAYIVRNPHKFPQIVDSHHRTEENYDVFDIPRKYLANANGGSKTVHYKFSGKNTDGRQYSHKSLSLQNITRQVRHTIARDYYEDYDLSNAHPNILLDICSRLKLDTPLLWHYVHHRNSTLDELMSFYSVDKGPIKICLLSIMNGGENAYNDLKKINGCHRWVEMFKLEMIGVHQALAVTYSDEFEKRVAQRQATGIDYNHEASFCNILMCRKENEILMCMFEQFKRDGFVGNLTMPKAVLCFDGIMVPKNPKITDLYLLKLEQIIELQCNIKMKVTKKPMDEGIKLPKKIPKFKGLTDSEMDLIDPDTIDEFKYIYNKMPVMANKTDRKADYFNNEDFTILKFKKGIVSLMAKKKVINISLREFQTNFRPSYCITAHKSQGTTINKPHMIHEFNKMCSGYRRNGQYVAITRTSDVKLLTILR